MNINADKNEYKRNLKMPSNISLENRKNLIIIGVTEVENFNDKLISTVTGLGKLDIKGENLNIKKLNLELGDLEIDGKISALIYKNLGNDEHKGFFSKLFK